jgi:hypothetical protein
MTAYLNALGVICALGRGQEAVSRHLFAGDCSGMRESRLGAGARAAGGRRARRTGDHPAHWPASSRNNQLLLEAALQIEGGYRGDPDLRPVAVGIVLGTSTSGIDEASRGIAHYLRDSASRRLRLPATGTQRPGQLPRRLAATERPGLRDFHRLHLQRPRADERGACWTWACATRCCAAASTACAS